VPLTVTSPYRPLPMSAGTSEASKLPLVSRCIPVAAPKHQALTADTENDSG